MTSAGSLEGRDRLRLFYGLPLPDRAVEPLVLWQAEALADADVRAIRADHLHVTLAFLGSRPADELPVLRDALRLAAADADPPELTPLGYRETERVAMLILDDAGGHAAAFQGRLSDRLERLGVYRRESRPWFPHLTVGRFRQRPRLRPRLPDVGTICPSDAALYHSVLRPDGAQYDILEAVVLGG